MKLINWLSKKLHIHRFDKPLVSQYASFNTRNIIFECRCGKRRLENEYTPFGTPFSIETTHFITNEQMQQILNNEPANQR